MTELNVDLLRDCLVEHNDKEIFWEIVKLCAEKKIPVISSKWYPLENN